MAARPTILIVGPTAGGKTELALVLAERLPGGGECICCDSMQVYRGMDIGTAKPTASERARAPHHLLDLVDPAEAFSVDTWLGLARDAERSIRDRGRTPIVVGGTNLYVQAFLFGLGAGPGPDPALRARLQAEDLETLRKDLERVDPAAATQIHPNDRKRTIRAIEVWSATGAPFSGQLASWSPDAARTDVLLIGLDYTPATINGRINARVRRMLDEGLVAEVESLVQGPGLGDQAAEALGYKQILEVLAGGMDLEAAVEQIKIRTRRFAKQQRTWLRRFRAIPGSTWIQADDLDPQAIADKALEAIEGWAARG